MPWKECHRSTALGTAPRAMRMTLAGDGAEHGTHKPRRPAMTTICTAPSYAPSRTASAGTPDVISVSVRNSCAARTLHCGWVDVHRLPGLS
jgi:hypothetical protein